MSSSSSSRRNGVGTEEAEKLAAELSKTLKEGERILAPTRRPDGTLRKPIRIRAGYVPQDEVAKYQSKGALWKKELESLQEVPPGYSPPVVDAKQKTKSAKRNERKKEKRQQATLDKDSNLDKNEDGSDESKSAASVVSQMGDLAISANAAGVAPTLHSEENSAPVDSSLDIDKKIRALKKKIRLTESQLEKTTQQSMKPEQLEKITKLEGWREELKQLEHRKAEIS